MYTLVLRCRQASPLAGTHKRPNQFLRNKKAKLLISQVENSAALKCAAVNTVEGGASGTPAFEHDIKALIINGDTVDIRVDKDGRVNLNDLHEASPFKGTRRKEVSEFMRRVKTRKLINSLQEHTGIPVTSVTNTKAELGGGTYAHPDVALAYAAWVDNDFYVNVAKTFGNVVRGDIEAAIEETIVASCSSIRFRKQYTEERKENDEEGR